ncbi:MAG: hypothetical protein E7249_11085 [Paenibacillaceae bacterium]|nr:hypothetical protein [Paenibacillaceae bacterium]
MKSNQATRQPKQTRSIKTFYYRDKDMILVEILDRYNESFLKVHESMNVQLESYRAPPALDYGIYGRNDKKS